MSRGRSSIHRVLALARGPKILSVEAIGLSAAYDIFKKDAAALVWVEATPDLSSAEQRVKELAQRSHAEYVIFDQRKQQIVSTFEAQFEDR